MPRDETRCIASVADHTGYHFYQCSRKRGHGPNGKYCKQHAKRFEPKPVPVVPLREQLREDIQPFVEAMLDELERHYPEKGDSWKTMDLYALELILSTHVSEWYNKNKTNDKEDLIDLANLCAMVHNRKSINCAELRRKE